MDRAIGSTETARTAREVVLVDPVTGAAITPQAAGTGNAAAQVQGAAAGNAPALGNPVLAGGRVGNTQTTYDNGDVAALELGTRGHMLVGGEQFAQTSGASTTLCAVADRGGSGRPLATVNYLNNGTTLDQERKPNGSSRIATAGAGTNQTVAKNSGGDLWLAIGRNTSASTIYLKIFNKSSSPNVGTDLPILTLPLAPSQNSQFDLGGFYFSAGIAYALTTGAVDGDTVGVSAGDVVGLNITFA